MNTTPTFENLLNNSFLLKALSELGFTHPTPVQAGVIPHLMNGEDMLAKAPTGTGKTFAFAIPMVQKVDIDGAEVQALVLCPTRELAMQITEEIRKLIKFYEGVKVTAIYGGASFEKQLIALKKKPQIVVGTPGRVIDHMERKTLKLQGVNMLVLDEADEMLRMGFREDIDHILKSATAPKQTALFSATMPKEILEISKNYQKNPQIIEIAAKPVALPQIKQVFVELLEAEKIDVLKGFLNKNHIKLALIFCNTKRRVDELAKVLIKNGMDACALHGDLRQRERDRIMKDYRGKKLQLLIATDVAARGIDVSDIQAIINFDLPKDMEYYVHRIGRTGRADKTGVALSLVSGKQMPAVATFEKQTNANIEIVSKHSFIMPHSEENPAQQTLKSALGLQSEFIAKKGKHDLVNINEYRYFLNIGKKDNLDNKTMQGLLTKHCKLSADEVQDMQILETFSFVETVPGSEKKLDALNGIKLGGRTISAEKSGAKTDRKPAGRGRTGGRENAGFAKKPFGDRKPFADRKPRAEGASFGERKPYADRKPRAEGDRKPFADRKPRAEGASFGDRKPFADRKTRAEGTSFGDRKPFADRKPRAEGVSFGDRKPFAGRKPRAEGASFGERKPYADRKPRDEGASFGERKQFADRKPKAAGIGFGKKPFGAKKPASRFAKK